MPVAYRVDLVYTTFKDEVAKLASSPFVKGEPILLQCPNGCDVQYSLVEQADATGEEIERHKLMVIEGLKQHCPEHPGKIDIR